MVYGLHGIVRDVRVALDENHCGRSLVNDRDEDTLRIDDIIASKVTDGVRSVLAEAPVHLLGEGEMLAGDVFWDEERSHRGGRYYSGWISVPDDFLRLISLRMSDWERGVSNVVVETSAGYGAVHSRYAGLRGNPQRPVVALVRRNEGMVLEIYSCKTPDAEIVQGRYQPCPVIDCDGGVDIPERCYRGSVYMIASLTASSMGDADMSRMLMEISKGVVL